MPIPIKVRYREHVSTASAPLIVNYKCSNCKNDVSARHIVKVEEKKRTGVYNDGSTFHEELKNKTSVGLQNKLDRIFAEYKEGKYDTANFDIKCPHCNHREPWSEPNTSCGGCLIILIGLLCIAFGILSFSKPLQALTSVGIGVGILIIFGVISSLMSKYKYKKIAALPEESLPKIRLVSDNSAKQTTDEEDYTPSFAQLSNVHCIYTDGVHTPGCVYTEVSVGEFKENHYYVFTQMCDRMNAGGYIKRVPEDCIIDGKVDTQRLRERLRL